MSFYDLRDALAQPDCVVCRLKAEATERYLDGLLWENVNDPGLRHDIRQARGSRYAGYYLDQLHIKGEDQVLNRSELIAGPSGAEVERRFRLEAEWIAVTLLGLVYTGDISLAWPGQVIDAGNIEEAARLGVDDLAHFKFIRRPKWVPNLCSTGKLLVASADQRGLVMSDNTFLRGNQAAEQVGQLTVQLRCKERLLDAMRRVYVRANTCPTAGAGGERTHIAAVGKAIAEL